MSTTKLCKNCNACLKIYRKYHYLFYRYHLNYCIIHDTLTDLENTCDAWQKKAVRFDLSAERFNEIQNDIRTMMHLLLE